MHTETCTTTFLDDLLQEVENKEEQQTAAYFDLLIMEINKLEDEIAATFQLSEIESKYIQDWALQHNFPKQEKIDLLKKKLEEFIRSQEKRTIELPRGILKIRKSPGKVEITDLDLFLAHANSEMITVIPETVKPDLTKIKAYMKMTGGKLIPGITLLEGKEEFKLTLRKDKEVVTPARLLDINSTPLL